ncbi:MAG: enoyl-CoA hydratase-related protein [Mycobacteriales bacterium]
MDRLVVTSVARSIATVTLNSPHNRNALSGELIGELSTALTDLAQRTELRVVVLTHSGPAFCSGADLSQGTAGALRAIAGLPALLAAAWELPIPLIAAVSGAVRGGGFGLLCAADIVLATSGSSFGFSEARVGAAPSVIWPLVSERLAPSAQYLLLTGETFDARRAAQIGLVSACVSDGELDNGELDNAVARTVAALRHGAPGAVATAKVLMRGPLPPRAPGETLREYLQPFAVASAAAFDSDEGREGVAAFAAKRAPRWAVEPPLPRT